MVIIDGPSGQWTAPETPGQVIDLAPGERIAGRTCDFCSKRAAFQISDAFRISDAYWACDAHYDGACDRALEARRARILSVAYLHPW